MTRVTAHLTIDGELYRVEGDVFPLPRGEHEVRIAYVYVEVPDGDGEVEDDAFDDWISNHEPAGCAALVEAFLAAKAA